MQRTRSIKSIIDEKEKADDTPMSGPPEAEEEKADEPIDCSHVTCGVNFVADLHKRVTILERENKKDQLHN